MLDEQKYQFYAAINVAFTPGAPINSRDLFAGRTKQVDRVIITIFQRGQHVVLFGERGVGKTSLANTLFDFLVMAGKANYGFARVQCSETMTFEDIWRSIFRHFTYEFEEQTYTVDQYLPEKPNSENVRETFALVSMPTIIVIDEMDRIKSPETQTALADTIKTLSDNSIDTTLIMVGVADALDQLIREHRSIDRAIVQVPMPRMSKNELLEIVDKGMTKCGLTVEGSVRERLADYSQGLPSYTHLLAREAALAAVRSDKTNITMDDLHMAIREAVDSQLGTSLTAYNTAISAPRGKNFKPVLLACALATKDEKGFFYATHVTQPLRLITGKAYEIPAFARHLKDFCDSSRGPILERDKRKYRFIKPLMEPYVVLRGLADGLIDEKQLSRPAATSTEPEQLLLLSVSAPLASRK